MDYNKRIAYLRKLMQENDVKSLLITKPENIYYLSGLFSTSAAVIITKKRNFLMTDSRYFLKAKKAKDIYQLIKVEVSLIKTIIKVSQENDVNDIGIEEHFLTFGDYNFLKEKLRLKISGMLVEKIRILKSDDEIKNIKKAAKIIRKSMKQIISHIKPKMTEKEIGCRLDCLMKENGADGVSFPTIIASGENSIIPHYETGNRVIKEGDFVLIDAGAQVSHYQSDTTRTFVVGRPSEKQTMILRLVNEAKKKAIKAVAVGEKLENLDKIARDMITSKGFGDNFTHGLGHGLGLEIHEAPVLRMNSNGRIKKNMVFTIEPAIYIEGFGGVRMEDTILVTEKGAQVLT